MWNFILSEKSLVPSNDSIKETNLLSLNLISSTTKTHISFVGVVFVAFRFCNARHPIQWVTDLMVMVRS
jgi:hypothetical protein